MSNTVKGVLAVVGRVLLVTIFMMSALGNKIPKFSQTAKYMAAEGVPMPSVMLVGAILFLIVGSLSIMVGFKARAGAGLLLVFLVLATYYFHDFWTFDDAALKGQQMIQFMKNLSIMGALVFLMANGAGPWSLDNKICARKREEDKEGSA